MRLRNQYHTCHLVVSWLDCSALYCFDLAFVPTGHFCPLFPCPLSYPLLSSIFVFSWRSPVLLSCNSVIQLPCLQPCLLSLLCSSDSDFVHSASSLFSFKRFLTSLFPLQVSLSSEPRVLHFQPLHCLPPDRPIAGAHICKCPCTYPQRGGIRATCISWRPRQRESPSSVSRSRPARLKHGLRPRRQRTG